MNPTQNMLCTAIRRLHIYVKPNLLPKNTDWQKPYSKGLPEPILACFGLGWWSLVSKVEDHDLPASCILLPHLRGHLPPGPSPSGCLSPVLSDLRLWAVPVARQRVKMSWCCLVTYSIKIGYFTIGVHNCHSTVIIFPLRGEGGGERTKPSPSNNIQ